MHKVFGTKKNNTYIDREGAYLIPVSDNKIGVICTSKGYFFVGGGIESGESHISCIERECSEEAGYTVSVKEKVLIRSEGKDYIIQDGDVVLFKFNV